VGEAGAEKSSLPKKHAVVQESSSVVVSLLWVEDEENNYSTFNC